MDARRILVLFALWSGGQAWALPPDADQTRDAGQIDGVVAACAPSRLEQVLLYTAGESFQVRPDLSGRFSLKYVPPGMHELVLEFRDSVLTRQGVRVERAEVTEFGTLSLADYIACPADYQPVCGSDGVTYSNACEADRNCARIAHEGEC